MSYTPFHFKENFYYNKGWNKFALQYARLLKEDTVYNLTKELMYSIVDDHFPPEKGMKVLDFNCGTGNDFPYFLKKGCTILATDYADGMLNKACETYASEIEKGNVSLFNGAIEDLSSESFEPESFDLIYSITGGFSYVDEETMHESFEKLSRFLKPGGKIITAHFGRPCLAETFHYLFRLKTKQAIVRVKKKHVVNIKDAHYTMHFRGRKDFKKTYKNIQLDSVHPLLFATPPYQTGFSPNKRRLDFYRKIEKRTLSLSFLSNFSDQFVVVFSKK